MSKCSRYNKIHLDILTKVFKSSITLAKIKFTNAKELQILIDTESQVEEYKKSKTFTTLENITNLENIIRILDKINHNYDSILLLKKVITYIDKLTHLCDSMLSCTNAMYRYKD